MTEWMFIVSPIKCLCVSRHGTQVSKICKTWPFLVYDYEILYHPFRHPEIGVDIHDSLERERMIRMHSKKSMGEGQNEKVQKACQPLQFLIKPKI